MSMHDFVIEHSLSSKWPPLPLDPSPLNYDQVQQVVSHGIEVEVAHSGIVWPVHVVICGPLQRAEEGFSGHRQDIIVIQGSRVLVLAMQGFGAGMSLEVAIAMNMPTYVALQSTAGLFAPDDDALFLFLLGPQVFFLFDASFEQAEKQTVLIVS
jgi:hypothetical protein